MRKKILLCIGVAVLVLSGVFLLLRRDKPTITEEQVQKIQAGMSLNDVEAILGWSPGNYSRTDDPLPIEFWERPGRTYRDWIADTPETQHTDSIGFDWQEVIIVRVWFDEQGKVIDKASSSTIYTPPSIWDRIRGFLKW